MAENKRFEKCPCMKLHGNKLICQKNEEKWDNQNPCELAIIGFDEDGFLTAMCKYDWSIIKMNSNGSFEHCGKSKYSLADILKNPDILLKDTRVMSLKEISKELGKNIIIREYMK